jgi:hypothetical protein
VEFERGTFYLGGVIDPASGDRTGDPIMYESGDLTTHGVIVGMTGSGKTGLGVGLLEESLLSGVPALILDPKGDMGNLLLNFPAFQPEDFRPWIDEAEASREGITPDELAARTADMWKNGLAGWGLGSDRMRQLGMKAGLTIYTPGSSAGVPINILGSLAAPEGSFDDDAETYRDEIEGYVQSLLTLAGIDSDPVSGPEHILLATIIEVAWKAGTGLDLAGLINGVLSPPFRKLGVFDLDTFFPEKDRRELALTLNGLVASPSFAAWLEGIPLDIGDLLHRDGKPQGAIVYMAHLSDAERQFVVTLLLSKLVTWMRRQSGTSDLRAIVYMDEVFGFCPPTANPPSKKPILTILKQARAFGVGMVLSTQNPVDLDYKAMSNAGTWMVGRLQTERDKARILEGLQSASGSTDVGAFDTLISGLGKRQFVLQSTKAKEPSVFTTRWVMSYLKGPLTRDEVKTLTGEVEVPVPTSSATPIAHAPEVADDATPVAPPVADGVSVSYLDPAAPWAGEVEADPAGRALAPAAVATVRLLYDDQYADVSHQEVFEAVIHPLDLVVTDDNLRAVDHDERDFSGSAPAGAAYRLVDVPIDSKAYWTGLASSLRDHLVRNRTVQIFKNPALKLYSRVGESREAFAGRCAAAAEEAADADIAALKDTYATRIDRVQGQMRDAERRVRELESDVSSRRQQEVLSGAGDLLGALLGGRRGSTSLSRAASRRTQTRKTEQRLDTAHEKLTDKADELAQLEDDLGRDVMEITARWNDAATAVEEVDIPLEKSDVDVHPLSLVWIPRS